MRTVQSCVVMFTVCAATCGWAVDVGQTVVVVQATELTSPRGTVTRLSVGTCLAVRGVDADKLAVAMGKIGTVAAAGVLPRDAAWSQYSKMIETNPGDASARFARGKIQFHEGRLPEAIADLDAALLAGLPGDSLASEAHAIRGFAWKRSGNKEKALADFNRAIELNAGNALALRVRGATYAALGEYQKTLADYTASIAADPENPDSLNHRAVFLAGCPDDHFRNGKQALADATKACELTDWKYSLYVINLAAAHAALGDFDEAIKWHKRAMELSAAGPSDMMKVRLREYEEHKPFRTSWR